MTVLHVSACAQNMDGKIIAKKEIGCKQDEKSEMKVTKLVVSEEKPFIFKDNKNSKTLIIGFHYGHWNQSGLPQNQLTHTCS